MSVRAWQGYYGNVYFEPIRIVGVPVVSPRSHTSRAATRSETVINDGFGDSARESISNSRRSLPISRSPSTLMRRYPHRHTDSSSAFRSRNTVRTLRSVPSPDLSAHEGINSLLTVSTMFRQGSPTRKTPSLSGRNNGSYVDVVHSSTKNFPIRRGYTFLSQAGRVSVPVSHSYSINNANMNSFELHGQKIRAANM